MAVSQTTVVTAVVVAGAAAVAYYLYTSTCPVSCASKSDCASKSACEKKKCDTPCEKQAEKPAQSAGACTKKQG